MNIQKNIPLNSLTTLEIGGPAKELVEISSEEELKEALQYAHDQGLKTLIFGGGSNLLISDQGFDGLVIKNNITGIELDDETIKVTAGTPLQTLVDFTIEHGYSGAEKLTGIPGSVGGAVYGNAGAYGQTISDFLEEVTILDSSSFWVTPESKRKDPGQARMTVLKKQDCHFSYRDSGFKETRNVILEVHFKFPKGNPEELKELSTLTLEKRLKKYRPGIKCPGSFFKNILVETLPSALLPLIPSQYIDTFGKIPAWFFLDAVGAKGAKKGRIEIADFHGNLFINTGGGKAQDFYDLAREYQNKVRDKFNITLEPEVQLVDLLPLA
jgi:UDP-N-acetylmuramate dehydrogenase